MIATPFRKVLWSAAKKLGMSPEVDGIDRVVAAQLADGINTAFKLAWEYYDWPQVMTTAAYTVIAHPDGSGARYLSNVSGTGQEVFGTVFHLWSGDPRRAGARRVDFTMFEDGYYVGANAPDTVWIQHRRPAPEYTDATYTPKLYGVGEVVYDATQGECYRCKAIPFSGNTPAPPDTNYWAFEPFPKFLATAVAFGAVGSFDRSEGQPGTASTVEAIMVEFLDHEIDQLNLQQRQHKHYNS